MLQIPFICVFKEMHLTFLSVALLRDLILSFGHRIVGKEEVIIGTYSIEERIYTTFSMDFFSSQ